MSNTPGATMNSFASSSALKVFEAILVERAHAVPASRLVYCYGVLSPRRFFEGLYWRGVERNVQMEYARGVQGKYTLGIGRCKTVRLLSSVLDTVAFYGEPVPEPPYRCASDEKLPQAQGYIWVGCEEQGARHNIWQP